MSVMLSPGIDHVIIAAVHAGIAPSLFFRLELNFLARVSIMAAADDDDICQRVTNEAEAL